jgi:hypothetical protein
MKYFFRPLVLGSFIFLFISNAEGQDNKPVTKKTYSEWNLRTNLSSWWDYDAGLSLGTGYRWNDRLSLSVEPTWIFYNPFANTGEFIDPSGIRIRADVKYYISRRKRGMPEFFVSPELHYKDVRTRKEDLFGINCQNGQCAFFQTANYTEIKKEWGGFLKLGLITQFPFARGHRWFLEFYGGLGAKTLKFKEINLPAGGSFINPPIRDIFNLNSDNDRNTVNRPLLPAGIRIYFIINP